MEVIEDLADVIDGRTRNADVAAGDAGFGADTLGGTLGMLKDGVQHRAGRAAWWATLVGALDLAGDLAFADDHAVEAGDHAEQMTHRLGALVMVKVRPNFLDRQLVRARPGTRRLASHIQDRRRRRCAAR